MPKSSKSAKTKYQCQNCGSISANWLGKCDNCQQWGTITELLDGDSNEIDIQKLIDVNDQVDIKLRHQIRYGEIDLVLGGGFVDGSVLLISGPPGVGKSTLLAHVADKVCQNISVAYISGEESISQVSARFLRLGIVSGVDIAYSTDVNSILKTIQSKKYQLLIIDSIQTITDNTSSLAASSPMQISQIAMKLIHNAKSHGVSLIIVGQITKDGLIAGPKLLEHMVDVVLNINSDIISGLIAVKSTKNRYGNTDEMALYKQTNSGLEPILDPSNITLNLSNNNQATFVTAVLSGHRPIVLEVQSLCIDTSFGYPRRNSSGYDVNRLHMLLAILEKRYGLNFSDKDVYINIVGGEKIHDRSADLAVLASLISQANPTKFGEYKFVGAFGEIGLNGEVRHSPDVNRRLSQLIKLKADCILCPKSDQIDPNHNFIKQLNNIKEV